ncbi:MULTISPECIES: SinI family restriction endonuclease [unclassified Neglectibacter]|uniref:SinI family restriction endonuclease n=1 Tax=unclassified Neglectibacter TaxID=2632164 RepID=UPI00191C11B6|nr:MULTISPECIES: SinI family restriction endonuclease [unclassified Neglectibacter]
MGKENVLANSYMSDDELWDLYEDIKYEKGIENEDMDDIFQVAMLDRKNLFPNQNKNSEEKCLRNWINRYIQSIINLPSSHIGEAKRTCSDPALAMIVKIACDLDDDEIEEMGNAHNLFMSAENIQGELLEEYIAENVEDYGWVWCSGNALRAVDFCKRDGSVLLQVKNKNNTENSSSSAIRNGTKIEKWFRLKTKKNNGRPYPSYE